MITDINCVDINAKTCSYKSCFYVILSQGSATNFGSRALLGPNLIDFRAFQFRKFIFIKIVSNDYLKKRIVMRICFLLSFNNYCLLFSLKISDEKTYSTPFESINCFQIQSQKIWSPEKIGDRVRGSAFRI